MLKRLVSSGFTKQIKLNENGELDKYKARLVAKGYAQQYGVATLKYLHLWQEWIQFE